MSVSEDGGVQSRSVTLGIYVRQTVGITSNRTDVAASLFLEQAPFTSVVMVGRWGHSGAPSEIGTDAEKEVLRGLPLS